MNYILTKSCNKGCPYCFAHESRLQAPTDYMTYNQFVESVEKFGNDNISLLGGEPTLNPDFKKIIDYLIENDIHFTLISNFLFGDNILNKILEAVDKNLVTFLVNSTDLDKNNRIDIWKKNYNTIVNKLGIYNISKISIGITIYDGNTPEYYKNYLQFIKDNTELIAAMRISLDFPGSINKKNPTAYVKNTYVGKKIISILDFCLRNRIVPILDCIIYPCLFETEEDFLYIKNFFINSAIPSRNHPHICEGVALDFDYKSAWACYPLKEFVNVDNPLSFNNTSDLRLELIAQKNKYKRLIQSKIPKECLECSFYKNKICEGPSICHYDLSKI